MSRPASAITKTRFPSSTCRSRWPTTATAIPSHRKAAWDCRWWAPAAPSSTRAATGRSLTTSAIRPAPALPCCAATARTRRTFSVTGNWACAARSSWPRARWCPTSSFRPAARPVCAATWPRNARATTACWLRSNGARRLWRAGWARTSTNGASTPLPTPPPCACETRCPNRMPAIHWPAWAWAPACKCWIGCLARWTGATRSRTAPTPANTIPA
ncbi:hypothetical protein D3C86_1268860 [compost metagenome]